MSFSPAARPPARSARRRSPCARCDGRHKTAARHGARRHPQQHLAGDDGRHETLEEMADAVEGVAREVRQVAQTVAQRHRLAGVFAARRQHGEMDADRQIDQRRKRKPPPGRHEREDARDAEGDFKRPHRMIRRAHRRPHLAKRRRHAEREERIGTFHCGWLSGADC